MASPDADVVVIGGGPAGSAAAIVIAAAGHSVIVLDRQAFPRDKPCGDGVTPRGVAMLDTLGLSDAAEQAFHQVDGFRICVYDRSLRRPFPHDRAGLPSHALVARRTELDEMLLNRAKELGAKVRENTQGERPIWEHGRIVGVEASSDVGTDLVRARLAIAADGSTSRIARTLGVEDRATIYGYAIRAVMASPTGDDRTLHIYPRLTVEGRVVPGYGWVFPLGDGAVNIGVGFVSPERAVRIPIRPLQESFMSQVPESSDLSSWRDANWQGWKLLMGLGRRPIWWPGLMLAGDAAGAVRPTSGAGISKALRTGFLAGCAAVEALQRGSTDDLQDYERVLFDELNRAYYIGRWFARAISHPRFMRAFGSAMTFDSGARLFEDFLSDVAVDMDPTARDERRILEPETTP